MTALIPPRYELPIDMAGNRITREWYKYLVILGNSIGSSTTSTDDQQLSQVTDDANIESMVLTAKKRADDALGSSLLQDTEATALTALQQARSALGLFLLVEQQDKATPPQDTSLLAWWPGDLK